MSTRHPPKGTTQMATRNPQTTDRTTSQPTLDAFADDDRARTIRAYSRGDRPDQIAERTDTDLQTVARRLRRAGVIEPWDDPRALAHLYDRFGSVDPIAREAFGGDVCFETVRGRMEAFGIDRGTSPADRLTDLNPEDIGLSPLRDDDHAKFSKRGRSA